MSDFIRTSTKGTFKSGKFWIFLLLRSISVDDIILQTVEIVFIFADIFCIFWLFSVGQKQNMAGRKKNYLAVRFCFNLCLLLIIFNNRILSLSSCSSGNYVAIDNGEYFTMDWDDKEQRVKITPNFVPTQSSSWICFSWIWMKNGFQLLWNYLSLVDSRFSNSFQSLKFESSYKCVENCFIKYFEI